MTITAAADGSALGNPGPNGWAWYIDDANWAAGGSPHGTNNQGELRAVLELLHATAGSDEPLLIMCDSKYVIDSITKWMPGWKRRGWRKADGAPVLNRDLMESLDEAMQGRNVKFEWVKGHAGHVLNEAADERANAAAKAYQAKQEPRCGPGFTRGGDASTGMLGRDASTGSASDPVPIPEPVEGSAQPLWAEASSLLDMLAIPEPNPIPQPNPTPEPNPIPEPVEGSSAASAIDLHVTLTPDEHARLRDRADAQGISLEQALVRLI